MAEKIERKLLAHYIDASFDTTGNTPKYVRLGKDLEEYNLELNPDVEVSKNIWGESTIKHNGYEPQSEVDPYYAVEGDPLYEKLEAIANGRLTGNDCMTTTVDVLVDSKGKVAWAYREKVMVVLPPWAATPAVCRFRSPFTTQASASRATGTPRPRHSPSCPAPESRYKTTGRAQGGQRGLAALYL